MREKLIAAGAGVLLLFLLIGGVWVGLVSLIPDGVPQSIVIIVIGFLFLAAYVWLLVSRVKIILEGTRTLVRNLMVAATVVLAMLLSFGAVYRQIGIVDRTGGDPIVIHRFWESLYFSVVTFTTLGYGDFQPLGIGRALASMQALTGYVVLGLLASVSANVISPHHPAGWLEEEREQERVG